MRIRVIGSVLACLALTGCTHVIELGTTTAGHCITQDDARRILGGEPRLVSQSEGASESVRAGRERRCEYVGDNRATLNAVFVTAPSEDDARAAYDEVRTGLSSFERVETLTGIGEQAFLSRGPTARKIVVRKGTTVFQLEARRDGAEESWLEEMKRTASRLADDV